MPPTCKQDGSSACRNTTFYKHTGKCRHTRLCLYALPLTEGHRQGLLGNPFSLRLQRDFLRTLLAPGLHPPRLAGTFAERILALSLPLSVIWYHCLREIARGERRNFCQAFLFVSLDGVSEPFSIFACVFLLKIVSQSCIKNDIIAVYWKAITCGNLFAYFTSPWYTGNYKKAWIF